MLFTCPRRECLFDSQQFYAVFRRIMELEESGLGLAPGQTPAEDQLPPEAARIHHFQVLSQSDTNNIRPVIFVSKPDGLEGEWHSRVEDIDMGKAFHLQNSMGFYPWLLNSAFGVPRDGGGLIMARGKSWTANLAVNQYQFRSHGIPIETPRLWTSASGRNFISCGGVAFQK